MSRSSDQDYGQSWALNSIFKHNRGGFIKGIASPTNSNSWSNAANGGVKRATFLFLKKNSCLAESVKGAQFLRRAILTRTGILEEWRTKRGVKEKQNVRCSFSVCADWSRGGKMISNFCKYLSWFPALLMDPSQVGISSSSLSKLYELDYVN